MSNHDIVTTVPHVTDDGLIKLCGATCGRVVVRNKTAYFEFKDRNGHRSEQRGRQMLYTTWPDLVAAIEEHLGSAVL